MLSTSEKQRVSFCLSDRHPFEPEEIFIPAIARETFPNRQN
jgi:hypothetical protein